jgi:pimeloyl-ACP methyl ester carboxylesterase
MIHLHHASITLALHPLSRGDGLPLLLLHDLGGSAVDWRALPVEWDGPVHALDFSGHGESQWLKGGGYTPELFAADADTALARLGNAAVAGIGLGAYVAVLLAAARGDEVPAALLLPGPGMAGAGPQPDFTRGYRLVDADAAANGFDPLVHAVDTMVRPPEYTFELAAAAARLLLAEDDSERPAWWQALRRLRQSRAVGTDLGEAFLRLAEACD